MLKIAITVVVPKSNFRSNEVSCPGMESLNDNGQKVFHDLYALRSSPFNNSLTQLYNFKYSNSK